MAIKIHKKPRSVTGCLGHAKAIEESANGKANTVWEKRTRLA
jgi:hypothetical protein